MFHDHHIIPSHRGGSDDPSNKVRLTVTQHAMWHWAEYFLHGDKWDRIAAKGLAGIASQEETVHAVLVAAAIKGGKTTAKLEKTGFQTQTLQQKSDAGKKGGAHNKANSIGYCGLSRDERVEYGRKGGLISGNKAYENKTGMFSDEGQNKKLFAVRRTTRVIDKQTNEVWTFKSRTEAAKFMGVSVSSITGYVKGHHQHKKYFVESAF